MKRFLGQRTVLTLGAHSTGSTRLGLRLPETDSPWDRSIVGKCQNVAPPVIDWSVGQDGDGARETLVSPSGMEHSAGFERPCTLWLKTQSWSCPDNNPNYDRRKICVISKLASGPGFMSYKWKGHKPARSNFELNSNVHRNLTKQDLTPPLKCTLYIGLGKQISACRIFRANKYALVFGKTKYHYFLFPVSTSRIAVRSLTSILSELWSWRSLNLMERRPPSGWRTRYVHSWVVMVVDSYSLKTISQPTWFGG